MVSYKAFLSYSQEADGKLAPALQSALQQFAKPWHKRRAFQVFRDETNLSVNPGLWSSIEEALDASEYFILLASPAAAASRWIRKELDYWLKHSSHERLLIAVTEGEYSWREEASDFDWEKTTALPPSLSGVFSEEPLLLDLRWARSEEQLPERKPRFQNAVAELAATLHGRAKDDLIGEDLSEHRKTIRLAWSAATALAILTIASLAASYIAVSQRDLARSRQRVGVARQLAIQAELLRDQEADQLPLSVLLAAESLERFGTEGIHSVEADQALRGGLVLMPERLAYAVQSEAVTNLAFSSDGRYLASDSQDGGVCLRDAGTLKILQCFEEATGAGQLLFSPTSRLLAIAGSNGVAAIVDLDSRDVLSLEHPEEVTCLAFDPSESVRPCWNQPPKSR